MGLSERENLQKNLRRLRQKDADMAQAVLAASTGDCELTVGRSGAATVVCSGTLLGSAYDPRKEGETIAAEIVSAKSDIVIAIGFGLGYHLEAVRARSPVRLIVYEPSAERMRAALAARPGLTFLADTHLDFASTPNRLFGLVEAHYTPGLKMQVYVHPPTLALASEDVRAAVAQISRAKDYVDISVGTRVSDLKVWGGITMQNAGGIMSSPSVRELFGRFRGFPAVIVSAGPSLDKQLPLLAKYRDRLLIICIGQALGSLRTVGIEPDLVHILESKSVAHQLSRVGSSDNVNLVVTNDVTPALFEVPVRSRFVATPAADTVGRWIAGVLGREGWVFGGSTVSHGSVSLAFALGANPIMLIGQDLAYTDGRHYAKGSAYDKVTVTIGDDGFSSIDSASRAEMLGHGKNRAPRRVRVVWVDGWYGEKVPTSPAYAGFIDGYRTLATACRQRGSDILNCTEGGARIAGLEHVSFAEALDRHTNEVVAGHKIITECFDRWTPADPRSFVDAIGRVHRLLRKLEKTAEKGVRRCRSTTRELPRARAPQRQIDLLRRVGRLEKELRALLLSVPWIDAVVQPEISASMADVRRGENLHATPEQAVREARFLFEATKSGVDRVRELLGYCSESVAKVIGANASASGEPAKKRGSDRNIERLETHAPRQPAPN